MDVHSIDIIRKYCENLYVDIVKQLKEVDDESESRTLLTVYQDKCNGILSAFKEEKGGKPSDSQISTIWKEIAQLLLDVTYVEEVKLVEDEFPEESAESRMKYIIDSLTSLETSVSSTYPAKDVIDCLGSELMECMRWRKGALLYMFCHTAQSRHSESNFPPCYIHYLEDGIEYLVKMLKTRSNPSWLESSGDRPIPKNPQLKDDTLQLIAQGIFSDTHLLALMYCGDLCYWYSSACCNDGKNASRTASEIHGKGVKGQNNIESNKSFVGKDADSPCPVLRSTEVLAQHEGDRQGKDVSQEKAISHLISDTDCGAHSCVTSCKSDSPADKHFRFVSIGNSCLKKYLSITSGPLSGAGWDSSRAEKLLLHFDKLKL